MPITSKVKFPNFKALSFFALCAGGTSVSAALLAGCPQNQTTAPSNEVVLYCSVDDVYARPIIAELEKQTGLDIKPLFDVESAKAAGLANKLRAEHNRPRADVFWASTILQSQMLAKEGHLGAYVSPAAKDVPANLKDPEGRWTAMGMRARVLIASKPSQEKSLAIVPKNMKGQFAISNPQFGTASDWTAAYVARWGKAKTLDFYQRMQDAGVRILPGNADVASGVADGNLVYGVTDSDDFLAQRREKKTVYLVKTREDNVLVPGCAAMVEGAPHADNAHKLLDALLSAQAEQMLVKGMPGVFSVRRLNDPQNWKSGGEDFGFLRTANPKDFDASKWRESWESIRTPLAEQLTP